MMTCVLCERSDMRGCEAGELGWVCEECLDQFKEIVRLGAQVREDREILHRVREKSAAVMDSREKAMLSAILSGEMMPSNVSKWDFSGKNSLIFQRMSDLQESGQPINRVTVSNELMKNGELEEAGGLTYLVGLCDEP